MDPLSAVGLGKGLLELGGQIAKIVEEAQGTRDVVESVQLYLEAAQRAVGALGQERQRILTQVRELDLRDPEGVAAAWLRLDKYLKEDNIRGPLKDAISGLRACGPRVQQEAAGIRWRKRDKQAAVVAFAETLSELESTLELLQSNFFPGLSGMGVATLLPIHILLEDVRNAAKAKKRLDPPELEALEETLGEHAREALLDPSHGEWFQITGKVEALIATLRLAFAVPRVAAKGAIS